MFKVLIISTLIGVSPIKPPPQPLPLDSLYTMSFGKEELNDSILRVALKYYDIKCPNEVMAQVKLESGNYTSRIFKEYNNPLGLFNSKTKRFYKFRCWADALVFYARNINNKYKGGSYTQFLKELGYAEDKDYSWKIQNIVESLQRS